MSAPAQRSFQLDGLRCIAVTAVILQHFTPLGGYEQIVNIGMFGVQLFFVLSGFLITGILLDLRVDRGGPPQLISVVVRFYLRRALRIFPAYYLLCAVLLATGLKVMMVSWPWHLTYLSDVYVVVNGGFPGAISHFWSLAVEEQFYLVWPWLMLLLPLRLIPAACACAIAAGLISRVLVLALAVPYGGMLAICNLDTLALGAWIAYAIRERPDAALLRWLGGGPGLAACALLVLAIHLVKHQEWSAGYAQAGMNTAMALLWGAVVLQASRGFAGTTGAVLTWAPIAYLGRISYGIYLYHGLLLPVMAIKVLPRLGLPGSGAVAVIVAVVATVVVAMLSFHLFERPLSELKRFIPYRPRPQPVVVPVPV